MTDSQQLSIWRARGAAALLSLVSRGPLEATLPTGSLWAARPQPHLPSCPHRIVVISLQAWVSQHTGPALQETLPKTGHTQGKGVEKHRFQQATALSWDCLGSSKHPVPIPAGVSQHDSGLLHLLPHWAFAGEQPCCLPAWFLSVCPSLSSTVTPRMHAKLLESRKACTVASSSGSKGEWQGRGEVAPEHSHLSGAQPQTSRLGPGQARQAQPSSQGRPQKVSGAACYLRGVW